jgi:hypothetical protein
MARQNAFITLSYISKLTGGGGGQEENLSQMTPVQLLAEKDALPETVEKTIKLLDEHFPFLKPMLDQAKAEQKQRNKNKEKSETAVLLTTPEMYHEILDKIFRELNSQRNQYTHVRHEATPFDKELIRYMKNCFDGAVRVAKGRFNLQDRDVIHLSRSREKSVNVNTDRRKKRKYEENPAFPYKFDDVKGEITDKGLAFFICLFLERKYIGLLLSQIHGFKRSGHKKDEKSLWATRTVFNIYNVRLPKLRIDSESSSMTLGIDMLNELKKCPAELFGHLDPEDQECFRIIPDEAQSNDDDNPENAVLLKRYENRFPQLALNYIDQLKLFPNVRFQVALGTYRYKFYDKLGVDRKERVRILQKKLHGFGRLQEIEERRKQEWATLIRPFENIEKDHASTEPYITDTHAQYMISNNRAGMYWDINKFTDIGDCLPVLKDDGAENKAPVCWLSIYELPAMIFHSLLCQAQNIETQKNAAQKSATQEIIWSYVNRYRKLFSDIQNEKLVPSTDVLQTVKTKYQIDFLRLPDEIRDYLSGKEKDVDNKFVELAEARILRMIKSTQGRRRKMEDDIAAIQDNKRNKVGKKQYVEIKSGVLAEFLAEELLMFQPTQAEGKDKLTGANYQALQATLAYYGEHKTEMKQILSSCKLLDSTVAHPFLDKVMMKAHNDIVSFYQSYLTELEKYLNKCLQDKKYKDYHFLHANRDKWQQRSREYYKKLAEKYLALPIELPRGLFNEAIQKLLTKYSEMQHALSQPRCNTVYLIQSYFKNVLDDGKQEFYDFRRNYKLFDMLNNNVVRNKLQQAFYTTADFEKRFKNIAVEREKYIGTQYQKEKEQLLKKRFFRDLNKLEEGKDDKAVRIHAKLTHLWNEFDQNEKILRLMQVQDTLLFLMAKKLLIDSQSNEISAATIDRYKLKDIKPNSEQDILSIQTPFSLPITLEGGARKTIRQEQLKLKNFGDFYRLIRDQRVKTLLLHLPDETIDRLTLKQELEGYDSVRVEIFGLIHRFERQVLKGEKRTFSPDFVDFVEILSQCPEIDRETKQQMQIIRNAFSHNSYPKKNERIRDVESSNKKEEINVEFNLEGTIPDVAIGLKCRLEKLIEDSLTELTKLNNK